MMFTYTEDGSREPFDPSRVSRRIVGCMLCSEPVVMVGVFIPNCAVMQAAVLRLRQHPLKKGSSTGLVYGLCHQHAGDPDQSSEQVEAAILSAAERVVVQ